MIKHNRNSSQATCCAPPRRTFSRHTSPAVTPVSRLLPISSRSRERQSWSRCVDRSRNRGPRPDTASAEADDNSITYVVNVHPCAQLARANQANAPLLLRSFGRSARCAGVITPASSPPLAQIHRRPTQSQCRPDCLRTPPLNLCQQHSGPPPSPKVPHGKRLAHG